MFARIALPASRLAVRAALPRASALAGRPSLAGVLASSSRSSTLSPSSFLSARFYAGGADAPDASLTKANIETRILDIFKTFDKVKQDKVRLGELSLQSNLLLGPALGLSTICKPNHWLTHPCFPLDPALRPLVFVFLVNLARCSQLSLDASFTEDLGLDSLDAVEVIMAIEEDFFIEVCSLLCTPPLLRERE